MFRQVSQVMSVSAGDLSSILTPSKEGRKAKAEMPAVILWLCSSQGIVLLAKAASKSLFQYKEI